MPRKAKSSVTVQPEQETKNTRKPYPSREERLVAIEKNIERLTKLNEDRAALIAKTEKTLAERKTALERTEAELRKELEKKEHLVEVMNRPAKDAPAKLSPEARTEQRKAALAKARAVKKAEKDKYDQLLAALQESGKSLEDLLQALNN